MEQPVSSVPSSNETTKQIHQMYVSDYQLENVRYLSYSNQIDCALVDTIHIKRDSAQLNV